MTKQEKMTRGKNKPIPEPKKPKPKAKRKKVRVVKISEDGMHNEMIKYTAAAFREGHSEQEIIERVKLQYPILTDPAIQLIIHKGSQLMSSQFLKDSTSVISLHVKRYDQEIKRCLENTYEGLAEEDAELEGGGNFDIAKLKRKLRIIALEQAMNVMLQKEKVLQLHNKITQTKIYNKINAKIEEKKVLFNLTSLSLPEKIEFLNLIQLSKKNDNELFSVILSDKVEEKVEDIDHEVVVNNNIDKMQLSPPPIPAKVKVRKGLDDITKKIHAALAEKALKEFKSKGAGISGGPKEIDHTDI